MRLERNNFTFMFNLVAKRSEMCYPIQVQGNRQSARRFEIFCQLGFNGKASLWRSPVTNLASGFPEQKLAKGVAGLFCVPQIEVPKSNLQQEIGNSIYKLFAFYDVKENVKPAWLRSAGGSLMELDFYIENLAIAFEIQGDQHFIYTPFFHRSYDGFLAMQNRDSEKRRLCRKNGVALYEITKKEEVAFIHKCLTAILRSSTASIREKTHQAFIYSRTWAYAQHLAGVEKKLNNLLAMNHKSRKKFQGDFRVKIGKLRGKRSFFAKKIEAIASLAELEFNEVLPDEIPLPSQARLIKVIKKSAVAAT